MNSGKTPESGFIGQRRRLPRGRDDDDDDFGRDRGNNASGFIGSSNARLGRDETGFEGLEGRHEDPRDFAPIGNSYPNERGNGSRDSLSFENSHKKRAKPAQKTEKPLTHIDRDTVGKVVELKDKYQRLKDRSNDKDKEMKITDMKIDALAERIREIDKKKAEFKDQLFEEKKKNNLLKKRLDLNEQEKLDLEQQLETGIKPNRKGKKGKGIFGNVDIEGHQQMLEERRRKEREEMRRQLFAGVDFLGGGQLKVNQSTSRKCWETVRYKVLNFFDTITPHKTDLKYISAKYDKATTAFFQFYRFVVAFSIILFVFFLLILTLHTVDYYANNSFTSPEYCNNIPWYFYYSRFDDKFDFIYALSYLVFGAVGLTICIIQWTSFSLKNMRSKIYTNEDILFSKMFFNAWNWNVYTHEDYFEAISYIKNETSTTIYEDIIREKVKNRTKEQKFDLVIRRMIFITLNVILIIAGVGAIFAANLFNNDIQNSISGPSYATALIPSLIVSFVNGIVPAMTKRITACEKYDFANTLLKQQIWRMFAIRILNLTIFMLLNRELAFNDGIFASSPIIEFDTEVYDWREDQAASNLARLMFTEYIVKLISAFGWMSLNFCKGGCGAKRGWRAEFPVSEEVVWLLYFQAVVWSALLWNPFVALIYPLMFYCMFKFIYFKISWLQKKPLKSTNAQDLGNYIMTFLNVSFVLMFVFIGFLLSDKLSHSTYDSTKQWGPFANNKAWRESFGSDADNVYSDYYPILWLIFIIVIWVYFLKRNTSIIVRDYAKEKDKEYKLTLSNLERSIARIKNKIELKKMVEQT